jgi:phosphatidate cytidylyltransferase
MYYLLKNLTATQQVGALFVIVFGLLLLASMPPFVLLSVEDYGDGEPG